MKIPFELLTELVSLCSLLGIPTEGRRIWEENPDLDAILNDLRPFAHIHFSDPKEFLRLLKENPFELQYAAERPARAQKLIRGLEELINPSPKQLLPGGGGGWLGLSSDEGIRDIIGLDDR